MRTLVILSLMLAAVSALPALHQPVPRRAADGDSSYFATTVDSREESPDEDDINFIALIGVFENPISHKAEVAVAGDLEAIKHLLEHEQQEDEEDKEEEKEEEKEDEKEEEKEEEKEDEKEDEKDEDNEVHEDDYPIAMEV